MTKLTGINKAYFLLAAAGVLALLLGLWAAQAQADSDTGTETADADTVEGYNGPSGIWVTGNGKASGTPDIAVVSLGVESIEDTAAAARANAARAMQSVMDALTKAGIANKDIQTRYFNISPRYQSVEVQRCDAKDDGDTEESKTSSMSKSCYMVWESRLIGYSVSNQATVKIRDLDDVGTVIDQVTEAAGNLVRINGISFNIEDPQPLQDKARANAVADMKRKAAMLAELSGVKLGRLVYLNEGAAYSPPQPLYGRAEAAFAMADSYETSISPGELDISATVQGVYLIAAVVEEEE